MYTYEANGCTPPPTRNSASSLLAFSCNRIIGRLKSLRYPKCLLRFIDAYHNLRRVAADAVRPIQPPTVSVSAHAPNAAATTAARIISFFVISLFLSNRFPCGSAGRLAPPLFPVPPHFTTSQWPPLVPPTRIIIPLDFNTATILRTPPLESFVLRCSSAIETCGSSLIVR